MLDFIFTLLIAPLEYWMHADMDRGNSHSEARGPAIVVMSLAVNVVILPIYIKAEKWQEGERALRKSFEAKEAMIKRTFKGQERFAMISTMHRQAGYSPFLSLRSSLGFFLQIPFFFAAYHFLSHFEPLAGVSFLGTTVLPMSSSGRISMLMLSSRGFSAKISANNASAASDSVACGFTCSSAASFRTSSAGIAAASRIEGVSAAFSSCASFGASSVFSSLRTATSAPFSFTKSKIGSRFP